jgi:hypothetical protein
MGALQLDQVAAGVWCCTYHCRPKDPHSGRAEYKRSFLPVPVVKSDQVC